MIDGQFEGLSARGSNSLRFLAHGQDTDDWDISRWKQFAKITPLEDIPNCGKVTSYEIRCWADGSPLLPDSIETPDELHRKISELEAAISALRYKLKPLYDARRALRIHGRLAGSSHQNASYLVSKKAFDFHRAGWSLKQIALAQNVTTVTVRNRIRRIEKQVR